MNIEEIRDKANEEIHKRFPMLDKPLNDFYVFVVIREFLKQIMEDK